MLKPNIAVYLLPFVTENSLSPHLSKLKKLEKQTDTVIQFNFDKQCFNILGETQDGCDNASEIITEFLAPILSAELDQYCLTGTYDNYKDFISPPPLTPAITAIPTATIESLKLVLDKGNEHLVKLPGRPIAEGHHGDEGLETEEKKGVLKEVTTTEEQFIVKEFQISPLVTNIKDFMLGPPQHNMQYADYINLISNKTKAECVLVDEKRLIKITGKESCVEDAWNRFHVMQKSFIAHLRPIVKVCIHYPQNTGPFGLFFCDLNFYRYKPFAHIQVSYQQQYDGYYVVLPVFVDPHTGQYAPPNDRISRNRNVTHYNNADHSQQYHQQQQQQQQQQRNHRLIEEEQREKNRRKQEDIERLDTAFARVEVTNSPSTPLPPSLTTKDSSKAKQRVRRESPLTSPSPNTPVINNSPVSASSISNATSEVYHLPSTPLNKPNKLSKKSHITLDLLPPAIEMPATASFTSPPSATITQYKESPPSSPASCMEFSIPKPPEDNLNNFPSLYPTSSRAPTPILKSRKLFSPTLGLNKPKARRVLRILPTQKSSQPDNNSPIPTTIVEQIKAYNYNNIKTALEQGLNSIRGFKGDIRLSAKLGKVLWTNASPTVRGQIWTFEDVNDILVRELGTRPVFTKMTTADDNIIEAMTSDSILPSQPYNKTAIYEFHCQARNSPSLPYKPTIIHMNQGVIDVRKVVLREKNVTEIDWVSLDRKYDFQLTLSTKLVTRCDVKPYKTFIGRISICPITHLMSYEHVPKFLTVDFILFKQTTKYRINFPFVVEVTRVEKVPTKSVEGTAKINAYTGQGDVWYDFEVRNTINDAAFEANKMLDLGEEARWTNNEILGLSDDKRGNSDSKAAAATSDTITDYVKNMLILIEKIERAINDSTTVSATYNVPPTP